MALQPTNPQSRSSLTQYPPSSSDILGQLCRYMNNMCCKNFAIHCMMYITWRNVLLLMRQVPGQPHPHNLTIYLTIISSLSRSTTQAKKTKKNRSITIHGCQSAQISAPNKSSKNFPAQDILPVEYGNKK